MDAVFPGSDVIAPARETAYDLLCRIELQLAHSDDVLNSAAVSSLEPRDRNLVTQLVYGTLRWQSWLDYILARASARPWTSVHRKARIILRMSLYQMARMDRVPDHAVINDAVELAKRDLRTGAAGFLNGVLRNLGRLRPWERSDFHRDCPIWIRVSLPRWLWRRWEARFGSDRAAEYALSLNQPPRAAFRCCATGSHEPHPASELVPGAFLVEQGRSLPSGQSIHAQDEASQLVPYLFGSVTGARVWDACAAPGGKSAVLRDACGPDGWVIASDLDPTRTERARARLTHCGAARCDVLVADARASSPFRILFDAVLADVPCSGLGTLRRNPEIKWRFRPESLADLGRRQILLLDSVAAAVRNGGLLLYSTCSTEPEENEFVVRDFLRSHPGIRLMRPESPSGIEAWLDRDGMFRSYPNARLWDGFFAALMTRS